MNGLKKSRRCWMLKCFTLVALPLFLGSLVYTSFRKQKPSLLHNFVIFEGIDVHCVQLCATISNNYFLKYNFSDAAWAFSLTAAILISVENEKPIVKKIYITAAVTIIVLLEVLQINFINGTFDILDLVWELIAVLGCMAIMKGKNYEKKYS
jgi:hypothetical protein